MQAAVVQTAMLSACMCGRLAEAVQKQETMDRLQRLIRAIHRGDMVPEKGTMYLDVFLFTWSLFC